MIRSSIFKDKKTTKTNNYNKKTYKLGIEMLGPFSEDSLVFIWTID